MQSDRYDYSPIIRRKPFKWPNDARVALMVAPNIEFFHIDKVIPGAPTPLLPDVTGYALRDYGSRIGVFRMMEVLDKHRIRATVLLNADVCAHHPAIIEEGNKRKWEWLGHGVTNNIRMTQYPADGRAGRDSPDPRYDRGGDRQGSARLARSRRRRSKPEHIGLFGRGALRLCLRLGLRRSAARDAGQIGEDDRDSLPTGPQRYSCDLPGRSYAEGLAANGL